MKWNFVSAELLRRSGESSAALLGWLVASKRMWRAEFLATGWLSNDHTVAADDTLASLMLLLQGDGDSAVDLLWKKKSKETQQDS